jgi:hypothetical protein
MALSVGAELNKILKDDKRNLLNEVATSKVGRTHHEAYDPPGCCCIWCGCTGAGECVISLLLLNGRCEKLGMGVGAPPFEEELYDDPGAGPARKLCMSEELRRCEESVSEIVGEPRGREFMLGVAYPLFGARGSGVGTDE